MKNQTTKNMRHEKENISLSAKASLLALIMIIVTALGIGVFSYVMYRSESINANANRACDIASSVAASIDADQFVEIMQTFEKNDYWYGIKAAVDSIKIKTGVTYLYVLSSDYGDTFTYFVEGYDRINDQEEEFELGDEENASVYDKKLFETIESGQSHASDVYNLGGFGDMISGFAPIFDDDGSVIGVVGIDISLTNAMASANRFGLFILLIGVGICLVFGLATAAFMKHYIGKPILVLTNASSQIAKGDMDVHLEVMSNDEIGKLTGAFLEMAESTEKQAEMLQMLADKNLSIHVDLRSDKDQIGIAFQKTIENFNKTFEEIQGNTNHVALGARQIANSAQMLAQGATEQAMEIDHLSTAITSVAEKTQNNAVLATRAAQLADSIRENAQRGSDQMAKMTDAVKEVNDANRAISEVIKIIDSIAFQTNILALNAAVEAARAGSAGKGFAVVAQEVRALAGKSAEAANRTGELIENSVKKAELSAAITKETSTSLNEIVKGIVENEVIIKEIASSSVDQSTAIAQINQSIGQIVQVVQQNSAASEQTAATSEEMRGLSDSLELMVAQYQLKKELGGESPKLLSNGPHI